MNLSMFAVLTELDKPTLEVESPWALNRIYLFKTVRFQTSSLVSESVRIELLTVVNHS